MLFQKCHFICQPLHRHCSIRAAEKRLRGDLGRLINPFPYILSLKRDSFSADFDALHAEPQRPTINPISVQINMGWGEEKNGGDVLPVRQL